MPLLKFMRCGYFSIRSKSYIRVNELVIYTRLEKKKDILLVWLESNREKEPGRTRGPASGHYAHGSENMQVVQAVQDSSESNQLRFFVS